MSFDVLGKPGQRPRIKLKLLWGWNKEVFGCIEGRKKELLREICFWDNNEEQRSLVDSERHMRELTKQEYAKVSCLEEIKWKQKAKVQGIIIQGFFIELRRLEEIRTIFIS